MIDKDLVTRKFVLVTDDLRELRELAAMPLADFLASPRNEALAERYLERVIGRMIDVNYHVLTESGQAPPTDYYDSFVALSRVRALDPEFATRIAACAGLRNRIAHEHEADHLGL